MWGVGRSYNPGARIFLSSGMKEPYSPGPVQTHSAGDTTTGISLHSTGEKHEARPRCAVMAEARGNGSPGAKIREEAPNEMDAGAKRGAPGQMQGWRAGWAIRGGTCTDVTTGGQLGTLPPRSLAPGSCFQHHVAGGHCGGPSEHKLQRPLQGAGRCS